MFILNFLATYVPSDSREAENVADRITPRCVGVGVWGWSVGVLG